MENFPWFNVWAKASKLGMYRKGEKKVTNVPNLEHLGGSCLWRKVGDGSRCLQAIEMHGRGSYRFDFPQMGLRTWLLIVVSSVLASTDRILSMTEYHQGDFWLVQNLLCSVTMSANIQPESELSSATKTWSPETDGVPPDLTVVWDYCTWKKTNETVYISFVCCTLRK